MAATLTDFHFKSYCFSLFPTESRKEIFYNNFWARVASPVMIRATFNNFDVILQTIFAPDSHFYNKNSQGI